MASERPVVGLRFPDGCEPLLDPRLRYKVLKGGRGSAKSWTMARALLFLASQKRMRIMCCRELQNSIAESVHALLKEQVELLHLGYMFDVQRDGIYGKNGTEIFYRGIRNDPEKVKSTHGIDIAWVEEGQSISDESWQALDPTIRDAGSQVWITYNPRFDTDPIHKLFGGDPAGWPARTWVKTLNYQDNPWFTEANREQMERMKEKNPLQYAHVWEGQIVPNLAQALWQLDDIDRDRIKPGDQPNFGRLVIAVDPAVTANKHSDETGIIAVGCTKGAPRHYYTLMDGTGRYSPEGWARKAMDMYETLGAGSIVFEVNQGGDMVSDTLRNYCRAQGLPVPTLKDVRASKGKAVRAEPIAALYSQGLVHHVGSFPQLERELLQFDPLKKDQPSPNRMDALVWGLTELSSGRAPMKIAAGAVEMFSYLRGAR